MEDRSQDRLAARLELESGYRFRVSFDDGHPDLITDLRPPLGKGAGPEPEDLLAAAVGNCLASSFLYCARKARIEPEALRVEVTTTKRRRESRLRISRIEVRLQPVLLASDRARLRVCLDKFESYCTVAESVRQGIPLQVMVEPITKRVPSTLEPTAA